MKQAFYDKITLGPRTKRKEGYETDIVNCRIKPEHDALATPDSRPER